MSLGSGCESDLLPAPAPSPPLTLHLRTPSTCAPLAPASCPPGWCLLGPTCTLQLVTPSPLSAPSCCQVATAVSAPGRDESPCAGRGGRGGPRNTNNNALCRLLLPRPARWGAAAVTTDCWCPPGRHTPGLIALATGYFMTAKQQYVVVAGVLPEWPVFQHV